MEKNGMREYITPDSMLSEARMMWDSYQKAYIFVEGETDIRFFETSIEEEKRCHMKFRVANGWENVYTIIRLAKERNFHPVFGVIDKDYHTLLHDGIEENSHLSFTDDNDIEMTLFSPEHTRNFFRYLAVLRNSSNFRISVKKY